MRKILFISVLFILGCKSKSKIITPDYSNCQFASYNKSDIEDFTDSAALNFKWLKIKTKVDATYDEKTYNFQVKLRIRKDSIVFAKISKAGFSAFRIAITKDSVLFVDNLKNQYFSGNIRDLEKITQMSLPFEVIQNLLLGEPSFLYDNQGYKSVTQPLIHLSSHQFNSELLETDTTYRQIQAFSCDSLKLRTVGVMDGKTQKEVWVFYKNYGDINGYLLNKNVTLKAVVKDKPIILSEIEIKRVKEFDTLNVPINIPNDYKKMEIR